MKSYRQIRIAVITLFAALAISLGLVAQDRAAHAKKVQHHHYKLIDMGTFGGSLSAINMAVDLDGRGINRQGTTIGWSATSAPKLATSQPLICGGDDGWGSFITHAFRWQDGVLNDLGALPPIETNCSNAYQVNAHGEIAGFSENGEFDSQIGFNQSRAVHWKQGQIEELGSFGGDQNEALAINNRGQIVGFSLNTIADPYSLYDSIFGSVNGTQTRAVLWQHGQMQDLGTLGGNDAGAFYINERGQVAGFSYTSTLQNPVTGLPPIDPFVWDGGKMVDLGSLGGAFGGFTGQGGGLNNLGQVIGVSSTAANAGACFNEGDPNCHPFLWNGSRLIDLNTSTTGGNPLTADGINDHSEIVGGADFSVSGGSAFDAYLWKASVAVDLGDGPGDCFSRALAINSRTQVVGNSFDCVTGNFDRAFLWENGSIVDLNALIPADSPLKLVASNDINDRGEIAGEGVPTGCSDFTACGHAFLLIPCDDDHPDVEGCDYSMVDADTAATAVTSTPTTKVASALIQANPAFRGFANLMLRRFGRRFGPWPRGLGAAMSSKSVSPEAAEAADASSSGSNDPAGSSCNNGTDPLAQDRLDGFAPGTDASFGPLQCVGPLPPCGGDPVTGCQIIGPVCYRLHLGERCWDVKYKRCCFKCLTY